MKNFSELAKLVTRLKTKKNDEIFSINTRDDNKYLKMMKALSGDEVIDEEDLDKIIGAEKDSSTYRMFRLRFREKLLNSILSSKIDHFSNYSTALMTLSRNVYCIRILILFGARSTANEILTQTLKKALEYDFAEIVLYCSQTLRRNQMYTGNIKEFNYYSQLYNKYSEILISENKASEYYELIHIHDANSLLFNTEYLRTMEKYAKDIEGLRKKYNTYQLGLHYFRIKGVWQLNSQDYFSCLETWNAMTDFLEPYKHFEYKTRLGEILLQKMYCYLYLRDYKNGQICAEQCSNIFEAGSNNWFIYNELLLILALHTKNYDQAGSILKDVTTSPNFKFKGNNLKERWRIFEAYYFVLVIAGIAKKYSNTKFRLSTFLNNITIHARDKKGFNTSIIILELMHHFLNGEYPTITEKASALRTYANRHFKKEEAKYRSNIFIKMIIACEKYKFNRMIVLRKTQKLQDQLTNTQFTFISSLDGIEIVPFTDLWAIVLKRLE